MNLKRDEDVVIPQKESLAQESRGLQIAKAVSLQQQRMLVHIEENQRVLQIENQAERAVFQIQLMICWLGY